MPSSKAAQARSLIIAELYRQGLTDQEIARKLKMRRENVTDWRKRRNLEKNLSEQERKEIQTCLNCTQVKCTGNCLYFSS